MGLNQSEPIDLAALFPMMDTNSRCASAAAQASIAARSAASILAAFVSSE